MTTCSRCTYETGALRGLARRAEYALRRGRTPSPELLAEIEATKAVIRQCTAEAHAYDAERSAHAVEAAKRSKATAHPPTGARP